MNWAKEAWCLGCRGKWRGGAQVGVCEKYVDSPADASIRKKRTSVGRRREDRGAHERREPRVPPTKYG